MCYKPVAMSSGALDSLGCLFSLLRSGNLTEQQRDWEGNINKRKRQKEGKDILCCAHSAPTTYLLHISLLAVTRHTWTHTFHPTEL